MFIVFEGIDGSGTTTQAKLLAEKLEKSGLSVCLTAEPTDKLIGKFIRQILTGKHVISPRALQLLFFADRQEHLEKEIIPALSNGTIVISDRYYLSSIAYASISGNAEFCSNLSVHFPEPDLTILLDIPAETAMQRINARGEAKEIFEKTESLSTIANAYRKLLEDVPTNKKLILDGTKSKEELAEAIFDEVRGRSSAG